MKRRIRSVLALAALAAVAGAAPSEAVTVATIQLWLSASATCVEGNPVVNCDVTLTPTLCRERQAGPACTAEPVTVDVFGVVVNGACVLRLGLAGQSLVVHTEAAGDVALRIEAMTIEAGYLQFAGHDISTAAVIAGAGFGGNLVFPPVTSCSFGPGRVDSVIAIAAP